MKRIEFKNLPDKTTPISADNLNQLQSNIEEAMLNPVVESITSKNKFNKYGNLSDFIDWSSGTTTLESDGKIKATSNIANGNGKGQIIQLKPNTTYTFSAKIDSVEIDGNVTFRILSVSDNNICVNILDKQVFSTVGQTYSYQFTTSSTGKIWLTLNGINNYSDYNIFKYVIYDNIQIEEGSTATDYSDNKTYGYISGSNENGSWVKYDDGRLIQEGTGQCPANVGYADITFPIAFIDTNYTMIANHKYTTGSEYGGSVQLVNITNPQNYTTTQAYIYSYLYNGNFANYPRNVQYVAIGRWK